jgi:hypothetical protein
VNLWSEYRQNPAAFAIHGVVKAPTGQKDAGVSTGKADVALDAITDRRAGLAFAFLRARCRIVNLQR